jgi:hypothetical protein
VSTVALILAVIALIVGIQQWLLAQEQTGLTRQQAAIAEAQYKAWQEQMARRPNLVLQIEKAASPKDLFFLQIWNSGTRVCAGTAVIVAYPKQLEGVAVDVEFPAESESRDDNFYGVAMKTTSLFIKEPIFLKRGMAFARIRLLGEAKQGDVALFYKIVSEHGEFPEHGLMPLSLSEAREAYS